MTRWGLAAAAAAAALCACEQRQPAPAPEAAAPAAPKPAPAPVPPPALTGWLEADGPGEAGVEWRDAAERQVLFLSCAQEGAVFRISLPDPAPAPTPSGTIAQLRLDAAVFKVKVSAGNVVGPHLDGELPVTPALLNSLLKAERVSVSVGGVSAQSGDDPQDRLAAFARSCAALTGIDPSP